MFKFRWFKQLKDKISGQDSMIDFPIDDLPEDVLLIILSFLPEPFLVCVAPKVSRKWKDLCQRQTLWRLKCLRKGVKIPQALPQEYRNYRMLLKNAFGRNLVKNWDASDGFTHWQYGTTDHRFGIDPGQFERKAVKVEESTAAESCGSQPLSELNIGTTKCWAISYMMVKLTQSLNFLEEGLTAEILDDLQPAIQVSVWTAARFDCASHYAVEVTLLDEQGRSLEPEVKFSGSHDVEQWGDSSWVRISHTFRNYGRGVRQLQFSHGGSDRQFWAGFFGPKIAAPCVRIELEDN